MSVDNNEWWNNPAPGSMLAAMTDEQRANLGASILATRELVVAWQRRLERGLADNEVDQELRGPR